MKRSLSTVGNHKAAGVVRRLDRDYLMDRDRKQARKNMKAFRDSRQKVIQTKRIIASIIPTVKDVSEGRLYKNDGRVYCDDVGFGYREDDCDGWDGVC